MRDGLRNPRTAILAFIAGYSLNDGLGARADATAVGFYAWPSLVNAILFAGIMRVMKPGLLSRVITEGRRAFLFGGPASFAALLIGVFFLKERPDLAKVDSTVITLTGAILLPLAR
ncbi:MAG: hypothetical protein ACPGQM_11685 [Alphaproteobacteria bacterium]